MRGNEQPVCCISFRSTYLHTKARNSSLIRQPYPKTSWCAVPQEDVTNKALCRPLPVEGGPVKPTVKAPRPVVGFAQWAQWAKAKQSVPATSQSPETWAQKARGRNTPLSPPTAASFPALALRRSGTYILLHVPIPLS